MIKTSKKIKITKDLIGRFVRVHYTDIGCADGICTDVRIGSKCRTFSFFGVDGASGKSIEEDQLIAIGPRIEIPIF